MTDFYSFELKGLDTLNSLLAAAPEITKEELNRFLHGSVRHMQSEIVDRAPTRTGLLRANILGGVEATKSGVLGIVGTNVEYAPPVEFGSKPHVIRAKNKRGLSFMMLGKDVVVKSVNHPGSKGSFMFKRAIEANSAELEARSALMLGRIVQRIGGGA